MSNNPAIYLEQYPIIKRLMKRIRRGRKLTRGVPCLLWTGYVKPDGYGQIKAWGKTHRVHKVAYYLATGRWVEPPTELAHICDTRNCCNPDHMIPSSRTSNE